MIITVLQTTTVDSPNDATLALATLPGRPSGEKTQLNNFKCQNHWRRSSPPMNPYRLYNAERGARPRSTPRSCSTPLSPVPIYYYISFMGVLVCFFVFDQVLLEKCYDITCRNTFLNCCVFCRIRIFNQGFVARLITPSDVVTTA